MSKIHFNNTFSSGCVQFIAADWPATTAHKMIYLLTSNKYRKCTSKLKLTFFVQKDVCLVLVYLSAAFDAIDFDHSNKRLSFKIRLHKRSGQNMNIVLSSRTQQSSWHCWRLFQTSIEFVQPHDLRWVLLYCDRSLLLHKDEEFLDRKFNPRPPKGGCCNPLRFF